MACRRRSLLLASLALVLRRCRRRQDLTFAFVFLSWCQFINNLNCFKFFFFNFGFFTLSNFQFCFFAFFLSIFVSEMVCLTFLQFLSCFFSGNSLIHSLRIDFHRYILHYFRLRYSRLRYSVHLHTDLHQRFPHLFLFLMRHFTLPYLLLLMGTTNWDNLALPELSELC